MQMLRNLKGSVSRKSIILLVGASLLSACGNPSEDSLDIVPGDPGGSGVFNSYFVPNWNAHEAAADQRRNNGKYTAQTGDWIIASIQRTSNAILSSGVEYAHAAGLTGAGQTVQIVDAGFSRSHETLAGAILSASSTSDVEDHGTVVASIVGGESSSFIGVAPGASLFLSDWGTSEATAATNWARLNGVVAQNNSWGYPGSTATFDDLNYIYTGGVNNSYINSLEAYAAQGVVVFAVSNNESGLETETGLMEGLPILLPNLESGWIAVANGFPIFAGGDLTNVVMESAPCFESGPWCITANGFWEHIPDNVAASNSSYSYGFGSSYAAPQVAGAMALLAEAFPALDEHELRLRLLASADQSFAEFYPDDTVNLGPGFDHPYSDIYGHGFLDIAAALMPIGAPIISAADGTKIDTTSAWMGTGSAMGDAVQKSLAGVEVKVTDDLGAGFGLDADKLFAAAGPAPLSLKALPRAIGTDLTALRTLPMSTLTDVFAGQDGRTLDFTDPSGEISATLLVPDGATDNLGVSLTRSIEDGGLRLDYGVKLSRDDGSFIGFGDVGNGGAGTGLAALRVALSQEFQGGGFFALSGEVGRADLDTPAGFKSVSAAGFNAMGLELGQRDLFSGGDRLSLSVSLPMAVTSGEAVLALPKFGDGMTRSVSFEDIAVDLSPNARQIDYALTYQVPLGDGQELMLKAMHSENYGNIEGLDDQALVAAFKWSF
jgi:subtilase-type serine protease